MPSAEYINGFWHDTLAIAGAAGFVLTGIGVWLALAQMRRTASASAAATKAAIGALDEN